MYYSDWDIVLEGESIRLTSFTKNDCKTYYAMQNQMEPGDPEIARKYCEGILDHTDGNEYHVIRLKDHPKMIGWIALQKDDRGEPDIGIALLPAYQDHGYGPEAIKLLLNRLYHEYGTDQAFAWIRKNNIQCRKAFKKAGAVFLESSPTEEELSFLSAMYQDNPEKMEDLILHHYSIPLPIE